MHKKILRLFLVLCLLPLQGIALTFEDVGEDYYEFTELPKVSQSSRFPLEATVFDEKYMLSGEVEVAYPITLSHTYFSSTKYKGAQKGVTRFVDEETGEQIGQFTITEGEFTFTVLNGAHFVFGDIKSTPKTGKACRPFKIEGQGHATFLGRIISPELSINLDTIMFHETPVVRGAINLQYKECRFKKPLLYPLHISLQDGKIRQFCKHKLPSDRISWESMKTVSYDLLDHDFDPAEIIEKIAEVYEKGDDWEKKKKQDLAAKEDSEIPAYFKVLFARLKDTHQKGKIGEWIVQCFFQLKDYSYYPTQVDGGQGLDGFFIKGNKGVIVEVKYSKDGTPKPERDDVDGHSWRQLSLPYVEKKLAELKKLGGKFRTPLRLIEENRERIKLAFMVFNPSTFKITRYFVGDLDHSLLD